MLASELLSAALGDLADDPDVRASLPLGCRRRRPRRTSREHVDLVRRRLVDALQRVDDDRLAAAMRGRALRAQRAAPVRPLAQLEAAEALRDDTLLVLREHLQARLDAGEPTAPSCVLAQAI